MMPKSNDDDTDYDFIDVPTENTPNPKLQQNLLNQPLQSPLTRVETTQSPVPVQMPDFNKPLITPQPRKPFPDQEAYDRLMQMLKDAENIVDHPYKDINGNITYGYGHMDNTYSGFISHPWTNTITGQPASNGELLEGYNAIMAAKHGRQIPAKNFKDTTNLQLSKEYIDELLDRDVMQRHVELQKRLKNYNQMDPNMQIGTLETHFNAGILGWPKLKKAAAKKKQEAFCDELSREEKGRSDIPKRNKWAYEQCMKGKFK